jgi:hypothetical protein
MTEHPVTEHHMTEHHDRPPELSVAVITMDTLASTGQLMQYLQAQTARSRIEIVIVCPSAEGLALDPAELAGFAAFKVVAIGPFDTLHAPRVAAVRQASAPIIAFTEDHCFPAPDWAEALLEAHRGPWAAVGPIVGLANPRHHIAWVSYFMQYGDWVFSEIGAGGEAHDVAGHNSSYKRDVLLAYGEDLDRIMVFESVLHEDLHERGHKLYVEPRARAYHVFITRLLPFCREHYYIGRLLASTRRLRWPWQRRVLYLAGSPLIPFVRLYRILRMVRRHGWQRDLLPGMLPSLFAGLVSSAFGEFLGYAIGLGGAARDTVDLDMNRWRYITDKEKAELWSGEVLQFSNLPPRPGQRATA